MTKDFTDLETYIKNNFNHNEINQINLEKMKDEIAMTIMNFRRNHHISQAQLSNIAHVPQSSIVRVENGENTGDDTLIRIANSMNKRLAFV